jgi:hypothetical protein
MRGLKSLRRTLCTGSAAVILAAGLGSGSAASAGRGASSQRAPASANKRPARLVRPASRVQANGPVSGGDPANCQEQDSGDAIINQAPQVATFSNCQMNLVDNLWWGAASSQAMVLADYVTGAPATFSFDSTNSDLPGGKAVWSGPFTYYGASMPATFTLNVTDTNGNPLPLISGSAIGLGADGAFIRVPATGTFRATWVETPSQAAMDNQSDFGAHATCNPCFLDAFSPSFYYQPDNPSITPVSFNATEGTSFSGAIATIVDGDTTSLPTEYQAVIDWADGSGLTAAAVSGPMGGPFIVSATHTYADEAAYSVAVSLSDNDNSVVQSQVIANAYVAEADALSSAGPIAITATSGGSFDGQVASFQDSRIDQVASDLVVTINWGDSNTTAGTVSASNGVFAVSGSHTYGATGGYAVSVTLQDDAPSAVTATATGTATFAPTANADTYAATVNQPLQAPAPGVLANDSGANLTAQQTAAPSNGQLTLNANGSFTFTPNPGFSGTDSFQYEGCTGTVCSSPAVVTITVAPVATPDSYSTSFGLDLHVSGPGVLTNDIGTALSASNGTAPANGTATLSPDGSFTYTPNGGFSGSDSFTYQACTGAVCSITTTVTINVGPQVVANPDNYSGTYAHRLTVLAPGVLLNDTGSGLTVQSVILPHHGTLAMAANGAFQYVPVTGFSGTDTFRYAAVDSHGNQSNQATVTISILPTASGQLYSTNAGHTLKLKAPGALRKATGAGTLRATLASPPAHGTLTLNANGSLTYLPQSAYSGVDTFTYAVTDGNGAVSAPATVTIKVLPTAVADSYRILANGSLNTPGPGVLANDLGTGLQATVQTTTTHGTLTLDPDGSFTYTPVSGYSGQDNFSYEAIDSSGQASTTVPVTITVAPVAVPDTYSTASGTPLVVAAVNGVLSNDIGTGLIMAGVALFPVHGTLTINSDGSFTYTPNAGFVGTDGFKYACRDAAGTRSPPTAVTLTVS